MSNFSYYTDLGLDPSKRNEITQAAIRAAYRKLAMQWHPDKNPGNETIAKQNFQKIQAAFEVLGDEKKRNEYDYDYNNSPQYKTSPEPDYNWGRSAKENESLRKKWEQYVKEQEEKIRQQENEFRQAAKKRQEAEKAANKAEEEAVRTLQETLRKERAALNSVVNFDHHFALFNNIINNHYDSICRNIKIKRENYFNLYKTLLEISMVIQDQHQFSPKKDFLLVDTLLTLSEIMIGSKEQQQAALKRYPSLQASVKGSGLQKLADLMLIALGLVLEIALFIPKKVMGYKIENTTLNYGLKRQALKSSLFNKMDNLQKIVNDQEEEKSSKADQEQPARSSSARFR